MQFQIENTLSNRSRVLEMIRNNDDIFRAEISRNMGLSLPTIMRITDELIEHGLVKVTGKGVSKGGKPPATLQVIPESCYFMGVDMGDSTVTCVILDLKGQVVIHNSVSFSAKNEMQRNNTVNFAIDFVEKTLDASGIDISRFKGIGIGIPGIVNPETGIASSRNLGLYRFNVEEEFSKHFSVAAFVENTAKAIAIAEYKYGRGKNRDNFIMIVLGTGIGSAMVINGKIYRGMHNMSGEFGHITVNINGPLCQCGRRGCVEAIASNRRIEQQAKQMLQDNFESSMLEMAGGSIDAVNVNIVMQAAEHGDFVAGTIADNAIECIAAGIENLVSIFDINYIIMSGKILKQSPWFFNRIKERLHECRSNILNNEIELTFAELDNAAAAIGTATIPLMSFIKSLQ